jgi:hypothetical protein
MMDTKVDEALVEARRILRQAALCDSAPVLRVLIAEVERLQRIETALRLACDAEKAWHESGGMSPRLAWVMCDARAALRTVLEVSNG